MPARTWSWREVPVLEAVLRLGRLGATATPETIADEAILHYDDVTAGIAHLVEAGYLDILEIVSDDDARTTIVSPSSALRDLAQFPVLRPVSAPHMPDGSWRART